MYLIGKITTTHGIKGEVKIINMSDFERFQIGDHVWIDQQPFVIHSSRIHKGKVLVAFEGYHNINDVLHLKNKDVFSKEKIDDASGYHYESLINKKVIDQEHADIGYVKSIMEVPQGHILEVQTPTKKVLIPFVDAFILDVNDDYIEIQVIEGLL